MAEYYPSFHLPRFSGSTLEPTVAPVVVMPPMLKHRSPPSLSSMGSYSSNTADDDDDDDDDDSDDEPSCRSLNRPNRPTFIHIPASCKQFTMPTPLPDDHPQYQAPQFKWDETTQTVYKPPLHRYPDPSRPIFWSN
ncbi:uncharacterized protein BX664DRAFT_352948 [Halteromyces radiatus]|uniref:uncharacterized protein n=1 Tax=Halteromyces radiatus TaxID=101107 RepID=UPI00221E40EE|nr:uncharacterized protein BX664DRAFT_352948 [Halteromyces radiatus]KAI8079780.1 hypothetical protein BX664DRAFT_352948 [Halteromyces radiatus]